MQRRSGFIYPWPALATQLTIDIGWVNNVYLQDPSLLGDAESYSSRDFTITFFQKHFKEWLPQVTVGDILVARGIRVSLVFYTLSVVCSLWGSSKNGMGRSLEWVITIERSGSSILSVKSVLFSRNWVTPRRTRSWLMVVSITHLSSSPSARLRHSTVRGFQVGGRRGTKVWRKELAK